MTEKREPVTPQMRVAIEAARMATACLSDPVRSAAALMFGALMVMETSLGKDGAANAFALMIQPRLDDWAGAKP